MLALNESKDLALVGGPDGVAGIYSLSQNRIVKSYKCGGGAITGGLWAELKPVISTSAGRVKIYMGDDERVTFDAHAGAATAIAIHPSHTILASVGVDKSYVLYDLRENEQVTQIYTNSGTS